MPKKPNWMLRIDDAETGRLNIYLDIAKTTPHDEVSIGIDPEDWWTGATDAHWWACTLIHGNDAHWCDDDMFESFEDAERFALSWCAEHGVEIKWKEG